MEEVVVCWGADPGFREWFGLVLTWRKGFERKGYNRKRERN